MRRLALGGLALLFLMGSAGIWLSVGLRENTWQTAASICLRVGLVLGAGWLAYDQLQRAAAKTPPWLAGSVGLALLVLVFRPRALIYVLPVLAGLAFLQFLGWLFKPLPTTPNARRDRGRRRPPNPRPRSPL